MTRDEAYALIERTKPPAVFVTGKTSTGKTAFAKRLHTTLEYQIVELDAIVLDTVVRAQPFANEADVFFQVYRGSERTDWIDAFVSGVRTKFSGRGEGERLVIEGAVARNETLQQMFLGVKFLFVYFHPAKLDTYTSMLRERFAHEVRSGATGLPKGFWKAVSDDDVRYFSETDVMRKSLHDAIARYAQQSQQESIERLEYFRTQFDDIVVVQA